MAKTPFLLSIMKAAYQGAPYTGNPNINLKLPEPTEKSRFNHLFNRYITQRLFNEPPTTYYYLMWLAKHTTENNRTVFNLEELQPSSLPKHLRTRYRWMVGLTIGIIGIIFIGILFGLSGWLLFGVNVGIVLGLVLGLAGGIFVSLNDSLQDIAMIDKISWYLDKQDWAIAGILGTVLGIVTGVTLSTSTGLISGGIFAFLSLAIGGLKSSAHAESRSIPNQGVRNSFVNGLVGGSMMIVLLGVALALAIGWNDDNQQGLKISIIVTLLLGVVLGVIGGPRRTLMGGIFGGLGSLFQHTILRFWLWRGGFAPLNYADFLIHSSELGLLRQVGGGFIFRHRYLQEYFAEEWEKTQ
ncbi:MAG: hypothetical protein KJ043_10095 [Anaerolineae bacterium]|nr:hypothetical protein [Anaerolineae bacterium]